MEVKGLTDAENHLVVDDEGRNSTYVTDTKNCGARTSDSEDSSQPYEKKYSALLKKCQGIQQGNDRLVNRIHRVKRLLKQLRKEKRCLMMRLDHYGDGYRKVPLGSSDIQDSNGSPESVSNKRSHPSMSQSKSVSQSSRSHQSGSSSSSSKKRSSSSSKHQSSSSLPKLTHCDKDDNPGTSLQPVKRPANPFFLFCQEQRLAIIDSKQLQENKGEMSHQELTKILAKNWNNLPIQEKKVYYKMYEKEKERYDQELKFLNSNSNCAFFNADIVIKKEILDN